MGIIDSIGGSGSSSSDAPFQVGDVVVCQFAPDFKMGVKDVDKKTDNGVTYWECECIFFTGTGFEDEEIPAVFLELAPADDDPGLPPPPPIGGGGNG